ncbi:MAG: 2-oxoacid:acceptor oxidoreductase family protein [Nanoarchaeota archaeon]|nr:2-oxoacid:acceptor oxidoreductase family protein [Nanoarchaeota archaeon]
MSKTILFVGSASQGIKTITDTFPSIPLSLGMHVSSSQFYESSPRKGAMGGDVVIDGDCQNYYADFLVALSQEGLLYTQSRIGGNTVLVYDSKEVNLDVLPKKPKKAVGLDLKHISKSNFTNTAAMGATLKLLGVNSADKSRLEMLLEKKYKGDVSEVIKGFDAVDFEVSDVLDFKNKREIVFRDLYYLMGNEAAVYGVLAAGANFFAGYPITPSSEAMHSWSEIYQLVDQAGFVQGSSEEHAVGVMLGANVAGGKAWTATSGPGLDRMLEQINWAAASKTPFVIYNVQRGGPSTGLATLTQASDLFSAVYGGHGDHPIIVLTPSTAQETYEIMNLAFKLAWSYSIGVIVNSSKEVAQRKNVVQIDARNFYEKKFDLAKTCRGHRTGSACGENGLPSNKAAVYWLNDRFRRFEEDYDSLSMAEFTNISVDDKWSPYSRRDLPYSMFKNVKFEPAVIKSAPEEVYICYGETAPVVKKVLGKKGLVALRSVYPYPVSIIKQLNNLNVKKVYVPENNRGVRVHEERGQLANKVRQYFKGDVVAFNKWDGFPMYPDSLEDCL